MNIDKYIRARIIKIDYSWFIKNSEYLELTGDIMSAKFFYDKDYCYKFIESIKDKFKGRSIDVVKVNMAIEYEQINNIQ